MMKPMKILAMVVAAQHLMISTAMAWPAVTTSNVNLRQGPSTGQPILTTVPAGAALEVTQCDESASWCAVTAGEATGFISGKYLKEIDSPAGWPRDFTTEAGSIIRLHQPQITEWTNFESITALLAAEFRRNKDAEPAFGIIGITADTFADQEEGVVLAADIKVSKLEFSTLGRDELADVALRLGEAIPTEPVSLSLARLSASLASYQQLADVEGLKADAPPIYFSESNALLVQVDGEAVTAPVTNVPGLLFVINTNWDIFQIEESGQWLLRDEQSWLSANELTGPWQAVESLPDLLTQLPDDDNWVNAREAVPGVPYDGAAPTVFYSNVPAEMVLFDGPPVLTPVPGTELQWIENTQSDLFFHDGEKNWYFLTSGRFFRSADLAGPWSFATPDLPDDFRRIPDDTPYYTVRASVPGTSESNEARLRASIPEVAQVEMGSLSVEVSYVDEPEFEPIDGTSLSYAVNSDEIVIQVGDRYYVVKDGVWFVGDSPEGPFELATEVPDEVYTIPSSSPVYNVTYVRIYQTTPTHVWYGYTPGYYWGYLAWGTLVFGSGWRYPPRIWLRPRLLPIYWARPFTFGFGGYYNPRIGVFGRYGFGYGPHRGFGVAARYNVRTGGYIRAGRVSGPRGSAGFVSAFNPRTGNRVVAGGVRRNTYGSWKSPSVRRGADVARDRAVAGGGKRWQTANTGSRGKDIFAGRDGNVYRERDGGWQRYDGGKWNGVRAPDRGNLDRIGGERPATRPAAQPSRPAAKPAARPAAKPAARPAAQPRKAPANVGTSQRNRQVGNQRAIQSRSSTQQRSSQRARPQQRSRSGGGRSRGGGGRRR